MQKLALKLVNVMKEVAFVEKKGNNEYHHYSYATSADVLQKVNAALTKHGICSVALPEIVSVVDVTTSKGNVEHLATVKMDITLIDAESGETLTITGLGSGQDSGDKAIMKAQTAAIKYSYLLSMVISTGDDPEADSRTDEVMLGQGTPIMQKQTSDQQLANKENSMICSSCLANISEKIKLYSEEKYGIVLCMDCQKRSHKIA